ncbi:MAG: phasin family protein [Pseudomonadales bacterium]
MVENEVQQTATAEDAVELPEQTINSEQTTMTDEQQEMHGLRFERTRTVARTLWQACLGAAVTLEHRTAKYFNHLAAKGARFQYHSKVQEKSASQQTDGLEKPARGKLWSVDRMHDIEQSLDKGRNNTLHWIGVSSRNDLSAMSKRVDELTEKIQQMEQQLRQQNYIDDSAREQ